MACDIDPCHFALSSNLQRSFNRRDCVIPHAIDMCIIEVRLICFGFRPQGKARVSVCLFCAGQEKVEIHFLEASQQVIGGCSPCSARQPRRSTFGLRGIILLVPFASVDSRQGSNTLLKTPTLPLKPMRDSQIQVRHHRSEYHPTESH